MCPASDLPPVCVPRLLCPYSSLHVVDCCCGKELGWQHTQQQYLRQMELQNSITAAVL